MNIYIEGSKALHQINGKKLSVKSAVYSSTFENKKQLLALISETLKTSDLLTKAVKKLNLLEKEHLLKNDLHLGQLLLYDYMLGEGLYRPGKLKQIMTRNKADIHEYFEKLMASYGVNNVKDLKQATASKGFLPLLPRYVRVNLLKTNVHSVISQLKQEGWEQQETDTDCDRYTESIRSLKEKQFAVDFHLPDVLVFPPSTDLHENPMLLKKEIVLQDKASCFPAHILDPPPGSVVMDCCAAPGNKTSHIASLMQNDGKILAIEKNERRFTTLKSNIKEAGLTCVRAFRKDFLRVDPNDELFSPAEYILLDPSCSGSGIVSRMNEVTDDADSRSKDRLKSLSNLQAMMLKHALTFTNLKRLIYSTCSVHTEENEQVVEEIYQQVKDRFKLKKIRPDWSMRGQEGFKHAQCFIRMSPDSSLTNGFFIACFQKRKHPKVKVASICNADECVTVDDLTDIQQEEESRCEKSDIEERKRVKSKKRKKDFENDSISEGKKMKKKKKRKED